MTLVWLGVAIGALLVLSAISVGSLRTSRRAVLLVVVGSLGLLLVLRSGTEFLDVYSKSRGLSLAKQIEHDLRRISQNPEITHVLVLEGSSYTARGLNGAMLGRLITRGTGERTSVIQLSLDGANHFERTWILETAMDRLTAAEILELEKKHLTLSMEIQRGYDFSPLHGFLRNKGTDRAYAYMHAGSAWDGLRAVWSLGSSATDRFADVAPATVGHSAINSLAIGFVHRGVGWDGIRARGGYQPLKQSKRGYRFGSMKGALAVAQGRGPQVSPASEANPKWLESIRLARYRSRLNHLVDREVYHSVPSTEVPDLLYARTFCSRQADEICLVYDDPRLLKHLDRKADWNDSRHMRAGGAEKFTRWFARRYSRDAVKGGQR